MQQRLVTGSIYKCCSGERERATSVEGKQQTPLYSLIKKCLGGDKRPVQMLFLSSNLKFRFLLVMTLFDLLITKTYWINEVLSGHTGTEKRQFGQFMGSKRTLLGKACGIKWGGFGNILGNALGTWWTCREQIGNLMWTHWQPKIFKKTNSPYPPQKKKNWICWAHAASAHLARQNFYSQLFVFITYFCLYFCLA